MSPQTLTDADYVNDLALLTNTPAQAKWLLHSLEQAASGIDLYVNVNETNYRFFRQKGAISTESGKLLKLENHFMYLGSNISSTKKYA